MNSNSDQDENRSKNFVEFEAAGLRKNMFTDKWEFFFPTSPALSDHINGPKADVQITTPQPDDADDQLSDEEVAAKSSKTGKKKKKKKKSGGNKTADTTKDTPAANSKRIRWGNVEEISFNRCYSCSAVPNKGSYPLGLGELVERSSCTVDEMFTAQQAELAKQAALAQGKVVKHTSPEGIVIATALNNSRRLSTADSHSTPAVPSSIDLASTPTIYETRQFDYKSHVANALFQPYDELERIHLLQQHHLLKGEVVSSNGQHVGNKGRPRAMSVDSTGSTGTASGDTHHELQEINNDIKSIKAERGTSGCNCKHIKVDKLSVVKMKHELIQHGNLIGFDASQENIEKMSKSELTVKVKEVLKNCSLCIDNNCECVSLGIQCNAQLCACMRQGVKPGQGQTCANPNGQDAFDAEKVTNYRRSVLIEVNKQYSAAESTADDDILDTSAAGGDGGGGTNNDTRRRSRSESCDSSNQSLITAMKDGHDNNLKQEIHQPVEHLPIQSKSKKKNSKKTKRVNE